MEKTCVLFLVPMYLLLVHSCLPCCSADTTPRTNLTTDQYALLALKSYMTFGPDNVFLANNWSTSTSNYTTSCCNWIGVTCGIQHQRVTALNLANLGLNGTLPPHLGNLSFIVSLDIRNNGFKGSLPHELASLRRLKVVNLQFNNFIGELPSWFGRLPQLQSLGLSNNSFSGTIPLSLCNISTLEALFIANNQIHGYIPEEISGLTSLKNLSMSGNHLSGSIPSSMYNMSSLQLLDLSDNSLSGSLPTDFCSHLPELWYLNLESNELNGQIPSTIHKCKTLQRLSFSINKFTGSIPKEIGNLTRLQKLFLSINNFEGVIPEEMGNLVGLNILSMQSVGLTGPIPSAIFNISSIEMMDFSDNNLSGSLPTDIMCNNLIGISLSYNQLSGPIPYAFWNLRKLALLLDLSHNQFEGTIPREIGNLTAIKNLYLGYNNFIGAIPQELASLRNLESIDLNLNELSGSIPVKLFNSSTLQSISLSHNHLSGQLPPALGIGLPNLNGLYLWDNDLSGMVPTSISNSSKLTVLDISFNSFTGSIPDTLGNLRLLQALNVRSNNLVTKYSSSPSELRFLTSLTNCQQLRVLDISDNPLNGVLPISIANLSTSLEKFIAGNCNIKGNIPMEIGKMSNLILLHLGANELTGAIPPILGRLLKLQALGLSKNKLQGSIPDDLCFLRSLSILELSGNELSGSIPPCIGDLTSLQQLYLNSNKFNSSIPSTLSRLIYILKLNLSSNSLSGSLPLDIGSLKVVTYLDISRNQLSGNVSSTIGSLQSLAYLSIAHNTLQGRIPESFEDLISLELLDLSHNNLSGIIPKSLEKLTNLKTLNVSVNSLWGEIPNGGPFANFSAQSFVMNGALCGAPRLQVPPCKKITRGRSRKTVELLLKYVLPTSVVTVLVLIFLLIRCRKRNAKISTQTDLPHQEWRRISHHELLQATNGFSEANLLGSGSYGSVYKALLSDGVIVATKVFKLQLEGAFKSFDVECEVLRNVRHRNLIKIISSCSNDHDFKALVLEYMPNWSLEKWLYSHNYFLDILQRLNIMIDVALALEYLHHGYSNPIVHCDLKPSNILLDEEMVAHVGDFGISKLLGKGEFMKQTITLATVGYMAPEYGAEGIVSTRGDVYSYGIMLMETFTRKKPTNEAFTGEMNLKRWVSDSLHGSITEVVDSNLLGREDEHFVAKEQCVLATLGLALECTADLPEDRINMEEVVVELVKIKNIFLAHIGRT